MIQYLKTFLYSDPSPSHASFSCTVITNPNLSFSFKASPTKVYSVPAKMIFWNMNPITFSTWVRSHLSVTVDSKYLLNKYLLSEWTSRLCSNAQLANFGICCFLCLEYSSFRFLHRSLLGLSSKATSSEKLSLTVHLSHSPWAKVLFIIFTIIWKYVIYLFFTCLLYLFTNYFQERRILLITWSTVVRTRPSKQ